MADTHPATDANNIRIAESNNTCCFIKQHLYLKISNSNIRGEKIGISLLSVDWDYFIYTDNKYQCSYLENKRSLIDEWYKRYIMSKQMGRDIRESYKLSPEVNSFWNRLKKYFKFSKKAKVYVSDSHSLSYKIAKESKVSSVYLFDAHSDLGYGGMASLNFEVNCANWLGKLLKEKIIDSAVIVYSPYTLENPEYFKAMNMRYNIRYTDINSLQGVINVPVIHICRSGAWVPPWFDESFSKFVQELNLPCEITDLPERKWDPDNMSLADRINYMLGAVSK